VSLYLFDRKGEVALSQRLDRTSFSVVGAGFVLSNLAVILAAVL
jgi:hypothetical protein